MLVVLSGRREGIWAGCLGSALADFMGGFAIWIGPTLLIKYLMAMIFVMMMSKDRKWLKSPCTFAALLYDDLAAGLASLPGLLLEGIVNIVAFYLLSVMLKNRI